MELNIAGSATGYSFHAKNSGTTRFVIQNNGNVGIGLTTPTAKLHIKGGDYNTGLILQATSNAIGITFMGSDGVVDGYIYGNSGAIGFLDDDSQWAIQHQTDSHTAFSINNSEKMRLNNTGLGIGATAPGYKLQVNGRGMFFATNQDAGWGTVSYTHLRAPDT